MKPRPTAARAEVVASLMRRLAEVVAELPTWAVQAAWALARQAAVELLELAGPVVLAGPVELLVAVVLVVPAGPVELLVAVVLAAANNGALSRPVTARVFVHHVRDKLCEQTVAHAQTSGHLPRDVQHEQRIRPQIPSIERIQIMRRDA